MEGSGGGGDDFPFGKVRGEGGRKEKSEMEAFSFAGLGKGV